MGMRINLKDILKEEDLQRFVLKTYNKGIPIYREQENPKGLYFIKEGLVSLTQSNSSGVESLLRVFPAGSFFGHRSFLAEEPYHATSTPLKKSEIYFIPNDEARLLLEKYPNLVLGFAQTLARDLKVAENRFMDLVGKRAFCRVTEAIIFLKHKNESFPWTRREIGEYSGVKTETVSRVLTELEESGYIEKEGRQIILKNEDELLERVSQKILEREQ